MQSRIIAAGMVSSLVSLCLVSASSEAVASKRMPAGSFLRRPVASAQAFTQALHTDPLVLSRYARLFHLTPNQVQEAFAHVHVIKLPQDDFLRVHYVKNGEQIGYRLRRVRKGTPVLAFSDDTPIIVQVCGNPIQSHFRMPALMIPAEQTKQIADFRAEEPLEMTLSPMLDISSPSVQPHLATPPVLLEEPTPVVAGEIQFAEQPVVMENALPQLPTELPASTSVPVGRGWNNLFLSPVLALLPAIFTGRSANTDRLLSPVSDFVPAVAAVVPNETTQPASVPLLPSVVTPEEAVKEWAAGGSLESPSGGGGGGGGGTTEGGTSEGITPSNPFDTNGNSPFPGGTGSTISSVPELGGSAMMFGYLIPASSIVHSYRVNKKR